MRRILVPTTLGLALLAGVPAAPAATLTQVTETLPPRQDVPLNGVCPFPVSLTDRGGQTLVTTYDASKAIVRQEIRGPLTVELTNGSSGARISLDLRDVTVVTPSAGGTATVVQRGGTIAFDDGRRTGTPVLAWVTGRVTSTGIYDGATRTTQVLTQQRSGSVVGLCDYLASGLKPRH